MLKIQKKLELRLNDNGKNLFEEYFNKIKKEDNNDKIVTYFGISKVKCDLFEFQISHINNQVIFKIKKGCEKEFINNYYKCDRIDFITENLVPDDKLQEKLVIVKKVTYFRRTNINDFKTALIDKLKKEGYTCEKIFFYNSENEEFTNNNLNYIKLPDNSTIYVKIDDKYYLNKNEKNAVEDLKNLENKYNNLIKNKKNENVYNIYEIIDQINSNIKIIQNHPFCKKFVKKFTDSNNGIIKKFENIIDKLFNDCDEIIGKDKNDKKTIYGFDEKSIGEKSIDEAIKNLTDKLEKLTGINFKGKDTIKYDKLSDIINKYNEAINYLDQKVNLYKEYKEYENKIDEDINKFIDEIDNIDVININNITEIEDKRTIFKNQITLDKKYEKYKDDFDNSVLIICSISFVISTLFFLNFSSPKLFISL